MVYVAKGGSQMRLISLKDGADQLSVTAEAARKGLKPCADILFESLVDSDFDMITCVVLTGMGGDGTFGIKQLKEKKNIYVIAQNEATCTVYGMPKVVAEAGLANEIVPLNQIADAINKIMEVR
jgi:two-component system chemotaxis response regulator CheB